MTTDGYGDHPISSPFRGRRASVWVRPRPVLGGQWLVRGASPSWGETDIAALMTGLTVSITKSVRPKVSFTSLSMKDTTMIAIAGKDPH